MTTIQPTQNNQNNKFSHTAIGATSLGIGAAFGGLWYKFGDSCKNSDGKLRDEFIKTVEENLTKTADEDFIKDTKWYKDKLKELYNLESVDKVAEFYLKNTKLSESDKKVALDNIKKMKLDDAQRFVKASIEVSDERYNKYFTDLYEKAYNKGKKAFVFDSNKISKTQFDCIKDAAKSINTGYAIKYGALATLGALGMGYLLRWTFGKSD